MWCFPSERSSSFVVELLFWLDVLIEFLPMYSRFFLHFVVWNTVKQANKFQIFLETLLVDSVRLMVDAGFPHSLILRENDDNENVWDMSISLHKFFTSFHRFRHVIYYLVEEMQDVFLGLNNLDKEKMKRCRRYLRKPEADVFNPKI